MEDGFQKTWQECCDRFNVDTERGLSEGQVKKNLEQYGPNGKWKLKHEHVQFYYFYSGPAEVNNWLV